MGKKESWEQIECLWLELKDQAWHTAQLSINNRVCVVSSLIQSLVSGCLYVECHKHQSYFSVYYFSHPPQIMLQEIDGNWINCCVYFKPGLVAGRTDLLDDRFDFFSFMPMPLEHCSPNKGRATSAGLGEQAAVWRVRGNAYLSPVTEGISLAERVSGISFLVFHAIIPFWCAVCHLTLTLVTLLS